MVLAREVTSSFFARLERPVGFRLVSSRSAATVASRFAATALKARMPPVDRAAASATLPAFQLGLMRQGERGCGLWGLPPRLDAVRSSDRPTETAQPAALAPRGSLAAFLASRCRPSGVHAEVSFPLPFVVDVVRCAWGRRSGDAVPKITHGWSPDQRRLTALRGGQVVIGERAPAEGRGRWQRHLTGATPSRPPQVGGRELVVALVGLRQEQT